MLFCLHRHQVEKHGSSNAFLCVVVELKKPLRVAFGLNGSVCIGVVEHLFQHVQHEAYDKLKATVWELGVIVDHAVASMRLVAHSKSCWASGEFLRARIHHCFVCVLRSNRFRWFSFWGMHSTHLQLCLSRWLRSPLPPTLTCIIPDVLSDARRSCEDLFVSLFVIPWRLNFERG
jgi:hypothetical protein